MAMAGAGSGESPAITFDHGPNGTFIRTGECCRCGECCVGDPFDGAEGEPALAGFCPLLALVGKEGEHKFACTGRDHPYYLSGCNEWPTHPDQLADKPSCTYRFEEVNGS